jgi:LysR family nitrogen assimilation transcriptional regulator
LGVQLLTRSRNGVSATEAGKIFYEYAQAIQKQICDAKAAVHFSSDTVVGAVVVAMPQSVSAALALALIREARQALPKVALHLNEELTGNLLDQLRQGRVDVAIFTPNIPPADFVFEPFVQEDFYLMHGANYTAAPAAGTVSLKEAASHPLVFPGPQHSHCTRVLVEKIMLDGGAGLLNVVSEINSVPILKNSVEAGNIATIMPQALAAHELASGRFVAHRIDDPAMHRVLGLCTSSHIPATSAKRAVCSLIVEVAHRLCAAGEWAGARPFKA